MLVKDFQESVSSSPKENIQDVVAYVNKVISRPKTRKEDFDLRRFVAADSLRPEDAEKAIVAPLRENGL